MVDLLFGPVVLPQQRNYRLRNVCLDDFNDEYLKSRYRFGRESIDFLIDLLSDDLKRRTARSHAIDPLVQVLVSLRFYASGSFLEVIGDTFGLPKSSVSRIVTDVSAALVGKQSEFIVWPSNDAERQEIKEGFFKLGGFPSVIGCGDGSHIRYLLRTGTDQF